MGLTGHRTSSQSRPGKHQAYIKRGLNFFITESEFEMCFGWDPRHLSVLGSDSKTHLKSRYCAILMYNVRFNG